MFWNSKAKDEEILLLKKGLYELTVQATSSNPNLNLIKENLKKSLPDCVVNFSAKAQTPVKNMTSVAKTISKPLKTPNKTISSSSTTSMPQVTLNTRPKIETKSSYPTPNLQEIKSNINDDDEWASF